jgi:hypothetical protein
MIFNNISAEKKLETLNTVKIVNEEALYDLILRLGLDPDTFDPEVFDRNSDALPNNVDDILDDIERVIASLNIINREIAGLED